MTKVICHRLLQVLPTVLTSAQLCSVRGRSIFDGILALASAVEHLQRRRRPGFLLNLDLFHAYDRVCLPYVDRVLEVMGFGETFRGWIRTLHRDATASFLLTRMTRMVPILFSIRQGDPLAMLLFILQLEPFLWTLQETLPGISIGPLIESVLAYVDDVDVLGDSDDDLVMTDILTSRFEAMSGAILNRNRKSAVLGLGSWTGRQDWPLPWLLSPPSLKVFGVTYSTSLLRTISLSWTDALQSFRAAIVPWALRDLPTLRLRRDAL